MRKMLTKMLTSFRKTSVFNGFIAITQGFNSPHLHQNRYWMNTYFFSGGFAVKCSL